MTAGALAGGAWIADRALRDDKMLATGGPHTSAAASHGETSTTPASPDGDAVAATSTTAGGQRFLSRPDLAPPLVAVRQHAPRMRDGLIFLAPYSGPGQFGPMIVDPTGELVFFKPTHPLSAANFRVQHLDGKRVLTWWQGHITSTGHGLGDYVIADERYHEITRVRPANGLQGDHHEFLLTPHGTALFTIFHIVPTDLSSLGGPRNGHATESVVQEVDVDSGKLIFQWNSIDHVSLAESYQGVFDPYDFVHANSIDIDHDGHLLVSARNTWTVYKIHRHTGKILWRLGGKRSDFRLGPGTRFLWQHDFRRHLNGLYSVFDNGSSGPGTPHQSQSRGLMLNVNESRKTVTLAQQFVRPQHPTAASQGNLQLLDDGNVFIGWGSLPYLSEYRPHGTLRYDAQLPSGGQSYRAFRDHWRGLPDSEPAVAVRRMIPDYLHVYASWNGSTEVAHWSVLAGEHPSRLRRIGTAPRQGFETAIHARVKTSPQMIVAAQGLDSKLRPLGTSPPLVA